MPTDFLQQLPCQLFGFIAENAVTEADFADIVQQTADADVPDFFRGQSSSACEPHGIQRYPPSMSLGILIFCFECGTNGA